VLIIDKEGVIRFRQTYEPGTLPDAEAILRVVEGLG
jgi:alkyl hydroperoxide reductase subunit AhpC